MKAENLRARQFLATRGLLGFSATETEKKHDEHWQSKPDRRSSRLNQGSKPMCGHSVDEKPSFVPSFCISGFQPAAIRGKRQPAIANKPSRGMGSRVPPCVAVGGRPIQTRGGSTKHLPGDLRLSSLAHSKKGDIQMTLEEHFSLQRGKSKTIDFRKSPARSFMRRIPSADTSGSWCSSLDSVDECVSEEDDFLDKDG